MLKEGSGAHRYKEERPRSGGPTEGSEMRVLRKKRMRVVLAAGTLAVAGSVGFTWAAWTSSATGSGRARSSQMTFSVAASTPASGAGTLYPSASATGSITFSITNPNPYAIHIGAVSLQGGGPIVSDSEGTCPAANVTMTNVSGLLGAAYDVAASASGTITVPGVLTMALAAPNACQDVAFTVPASASATAF